MGRWYLGVKLKHIFYAMGYIILRPYLRVKGHITVKYLNLPNKYDTCNISPGTNFMNKLDDSIYNSFKNLNNQKNKNNPNIIISGSNTPGEGEHKIFNFIRNNPNDHLQSNTVIYGIDADLFMISLCNLKFCKNIYLYRETPEFIKSIDNTLESNRLYIISINNLAQLIISKINPKLNYSYLPKKEDEPFNRIPSIKLSKNILGWEPKVNLDQGLDFTINFYRKFLNK